MKLHDIVREVIDLTLEARDDKSFTVKQARTMTHKFHRSISANEYRGILEELYGPPASNGRYNTQT